MKTAVLPLTAIAASLGFLAACGNGKQPAPEETTGFDDVKPLLTSTCLPCHHSQTLLGDLNLESRKTAFGGRDGQAFIVPGDPDSSLLYLVTENPHGKRPALEKMPAMKDIFLEPEERELLRKWIEQGAEWPSGEAGWLKPLVIENQKS